MKIFHTADWHLGKLVQGISMIEDQAFILQQFLQDIDEERPDVVVIAGDLYDRSVPATEAVALLDDIFSEIAIKRDIPVVAISGNHDSPGRIHFGSRFMGAKGLHIMGNLSKDLKPVVLHDEFGEVHFHLIPYTDPSHVRYLYADDTIKTQQDAMAKIIANVVDSLDSSARHVLVGHAFVTKDGADEENATDAERPLSIGGSECIDAKLFEPFHYTALGHLHQAHFVDSEKIRYSGSPLKYSISEETHKKGYLMVDLSADGSIHVTKKELMPKRDLKTVESTMEEILKSPKNEDYVFVKLLDDTPIISPMEKIRSVYPNAMHVERVILKDFSDVQHEIVSRQKMDDMTLFTSFYREILGKDADDETIELFQEVLQEELLLQREVEVKNV
ncbi:exonuclease SbcCD subunit D [Rummeliibacillus suwonensis]|uniref:exonuclease SbcCD subunit D n=1 Tax=Rummeliibacillus suwonensis TaxID=1306154 RepID=UPI001AAEA488|nr:exonuclease SbcCD subunit D [Rummeliibacillus suwonensis]MBO2537718.1 exonuclease SbcCD subunit D [Rummeliibacillus suwonensis]